MIFRLSQKLNARIKAGNLIARPLNKNPYADWSATAFVADRTQYILLCNTKSPYSTVMYARGINDDHRFIERAMDSIREYMEADGQEFVYRQFIASATGAVGFAKALDRSITGSVNDLVYHAKGWLVETQLSPFDVGFKLNDIPFSSLKYVRPRETFKALLAEADN